MSSMVGQGTWELPAKANAKAQCDYLALMKDGLVFEGKEITGALAVGIFKQTFDNTGGQDGFPVRVQPGSIYEWFRFLNSTSGDKLTVADYGKDCYATAEPWRVAKTDGSGARSKAGRVWFVKDNYVYITINPLA